MGDLRVRQVSGVSTGKGQVQKSAKSARLRQIKVISACYGRVREVCKMLEDWDDFESQG